MSRAQPKTATVADVQELLSTDYPPQFIVCREKRHNWKPYVVDHLGKVWHRYQKCDSCESIQMSTFTERNGRAVRSTKSRIAYVFGYQLKGFGHIRQEAREVLVLEVLRREFDELNNHERL